MNRPYSAIALALILAAGCNHSKQPSERELANRRWNEARASILYGVAQDQYKAHDFDKCRDTLSQALKMTPESPQLHTLAARLDIEQGQLELAERELEAARKFGPGDPEPYYLSGVIYQRWQKPQLALDFYQQASKHGPAELAYVLAQSEMLVAMHRLPEALELLESKVAYFENSASIRDAAGQLLMQLARYADAVDMFRQASVLSEEDSSIRERLAMAYYSNHQYHEAADILTQLVQQESYSKRADLFQLLGECQLAANDAHGATTSYSTATEISPEVAGAWQGLGRAALQLGDLRRADFALRRSISIDPSASESHLLMGYVRLKNGKLQDALDSFQRASSLDSADTTSLCMIGYTLEKLRRPQEAMQYYARALRINPADQMASQFMAGVDR